MKVINSGIFGRKFLHGMFMEQLHKKRKKEIILSLATTTNL
jgi:hypothetical protein